MRMQLFNSHHSEQLAAQLAHHADQLRQSRAGLLAEASTTRWASPAAGVFHQALQSLLHELAACSERCEQSAAQLRKHGQRAQHRAHELAVVAAGAGATATEVAGAVTHPGRLVRGLFTAL
jgi:uncharacterized protein (DUF3084 family)